jgi:phosphoinositide-3-kinase regulatory subunit 4
MIAQMLSREPSDRPTFDRILTTYRGTIFPEYFYTFLKEYVSELNELPPSQDTDFLQRSSTLPGTKIDRMLEQWESIRVHLEDKSTNDSEWVPILKADPRWPSLTAAQHRDVVDPQLSIAELPTTRSAALPQAVAIPHGRGQGRPHCAVRRRALVRRSAHR